MKAEAVALAIGAACCLFGCPRAEATEYEIWAKRAVPREDAENWKRIRERDEEPFEGLEDCRQAAAGMLAHRLVNLESGWVLRCDPVPVPWPRVVVR